jgi:hypothetical protein
MFTGLQTVFIYFHGATPGQSFLKLYMTFEQKPSHLFFQIWLRQIGFVCSLFFLGLPFLAVIYHNKHRAFYDRMAECDVLSHVSLEERSFVIHDIDKKYLSASVSALMCFASLIFIFSFFQSHESLVHKIQLTGVLKPQVKTCFVIEKQNQEERLKTALALNILNLTSDDCALTEADDVFNKMKIAANNDSMAQDISLAYFIKFYIAQKTLSSGLNQAEYLKYACGHGIKTDLCAAIENRHVASENSKVISSKKLNDKLLEYIGKAK